MFVHGRTQYLRQWFDLQVTDALWQPCGALTGVAGSLLVDQNGVPWPRAVALDAKVLVGVYAVVVEQSLINLHCVDL